MLRKTHLIVSLAVFASACVALPSHAKDIGLIAGFGWNTFDVDRNAVGTSVWADIANNSFEKLFFTFTVDTGFTASLTVLDGAFAGNTFAVFNGSTLLGNTSAVAVVDQAAASFSSSYDSALLDAAYSRGVFAFGAGTYRINGELLQAGLDTGVPVFATEAALSLTVSPVPEPSSFATLLAGLLMAAFVLRRKDR